MFSDEVSMKFEHVVFDTCNSEDYFFATEK